MRPRHRQAPPGVLCSNARCDVRLLLRGDAWVLGRVLRHQELPQDAPHESHGALQVKQRPPADHGHHPLRHWASERSADGQAWRRGRERGGRGLV